MPTIEELHIAAGQGDMDAQNDLGMLYLTGKATEQGDAVAKSAMEVQFFTNNEEDLAKGIELLRKAADQGCVNAYNNLAIAYYHGYGVEKDYVEAVKLLHKVAEKGTENVTAAANYNLGLAYFLGRGVTKNRKTAIQHWHEAAANGSVWAQRRLGICYDYGRDVTQSYEEADKWYRKAAEQGDRLAMKRLSRPKWLRFFIRWW